MIEEALLTGTLEPTNEPYAIAKISIREVAALIGKVVGFRGRIEYDSSRPDGAPRKLMDVSKLAALGWKARVGLEEGLELTYKDFLAGHRR